MPPLRATSLLFCGHKMATNYKTEIRTHREHSNKVVCPCNAKRNENEGGTVETWYNPWEVLKSGSPLLYVDRE